MSAQRTHYSLEGVEAPSCVLRVPDEMALSHVWRNGESVALKSSSLLAMC
jgi:hypothetical protein